MEVLADIETYHKGPQLNHGQSGRREVLECEQLLPKWSVKKKGIVGRETAYAKTNDLA